MPLSKGTTRWGYFIAFILLLVSYFLIFFIIDKQVSETRRVAHSQTVINNLEMVKSQITDSETGVRGYVITRDTAFLRPYKTGSSNVMPLFKELRSLTTDNKDYAQELDSLDRLITRRLNHLAQAIKNYEENNFQLPASTMANRYQAKNNMDSIRLWIARIKAEEVSLMQERNARLNGFFSGTGIITATSLVIALFTIFYSLVTYNKGNRQKEAADHMAKEYSRQLEERVIELDKVNAELEELKSVEKFTSTGRIARTIAHEVRNPLTNISLASEQLKDIASGNPEADLLLDMIARNATRINQLVSDLLNSTRFAQLEYGLTDINQLLDETLELASDRIELSKVRIEKQYEKSNCVILVDKEKMKLAFLNIIVNAIEAMPEGSGLLQISTRSSSNRCFIEIRDNGSGMDEDTMQKLFDPYFTGKAKGNGLGLTNTQNIILNHKGHISVRSKPGKGSSFIITLSINREEKETGSLQV